MIQRASFAVVAAIAAMFAMPPGAVLAQELDLEQDEETTLPPDSVPGQTVPRYREARPDEPGLRYKRVEPPGSVPSQPVPNYPVPQSPAPRYGQNDSYEQEETEDDVLSRPRQTVPQARPVPRGRYDSDDGLEPEDPAFSEPETAEGITANQALRIARGEGMSRAAQVREGRRGFVITGRDMDGFNMRIVIDRNGDVIDLRRE